MPVKSGQFGFIAVGSSNMAAVRNWRFRMEANIPTFSHSDSGGYVENVEGKKSGTISGEFYFNNDAPVEELLVVGTLYTFKLYTDATRFYQASARLQSLEINNNTETDEPASGSFEAITSGAWTLPT